MTTRSQISSYPRVVSSVYDLQKGAQVIALSNSQRLAAIGCSGEVRILRIDSPTGITDMCSHTSTAPNSCITDLSWSPVDVGKLLAISYSNGSIVCLNVAEKASRQSQILTEVWSSGKVSSGINRLSWHPFDEKLIASANQDGIVRLFDFRAPTATAKVASFGQRGFAATRDIEFDPFHAHIFAEVSDNGMLKVWDKRYASKPVVSKPKTHAGPIMTVSWSPCWEWVLATGSRDKTVKIWDVSQCGATYEEEDTVAVTPENVFGAVLGSPHGLGHSAVTPAPPASASTASSSKETIDPVLVNTLFTHSEVSRLRWSITAASNGPGTTPTAASIAPLLATIPTGAGTSAESAGHIAVWDLLNQYLPLCMLKGHGQDMCADFGWLNHNPPSANTNSGAASTLATAATTAATSAVAAATASSTATAPGRGGGRSGVGRGKQADARRRSQVSVDANTTTTAAAGPESPTKQLNPVTSLVLGILSVGRDGKVLMQDLRYGYFPNHHISPSVTAISSQGHVAFHRGYVHKKFSTSVRSPYYFDTFSSYCAALEIFRRREAPETVQRPLPMLRSTNSADNLASYAVNKTALSKLRVKPPGADASGSSAAQSATTDPSNVVQDRRSGVVFFGSQIIRSLEEAQAIRLERAAEARVTDPALIALFARRYRTPYTISATAVPVSQTREGTVDECELDGPQRDRLRQLRKLERMYQLALCACQSNLEAAVSAGLHCRVAVWTTLLSMLPPPTLPEPTQLVEEVALPDGSSPQQLLLGDAFAHREVGMLPLSRSESGNDSPLRPSRRSSFAARPSNKVSSRNVFPELPFTLELIGTLLGELLEGGDVQHFVVACEILRTGSVLPDILKAVNLSEVRVQRGYLVYIDLLTKLGLFCEATDLLKASEDKYMSALNKVGVQVGLKCGTCGKELSSATSTGWCERCERCVSICVVCNRPASGLVHWCPLCAHGGHLACTKRWFRQSIECPAGCGHNCCNTLLDKRGINAAERSGYRRMDALRELEICLATAAPRSRSSSRASARNGTGADASHSAARIWHQLPAGVTVSPRTVSRHLLRQRKIAAMQAAGI